MSPSHSIALARALQLELIANPAPLSAAAGGAEPVVVQVGAEATTVDPEPGRTGETTHLRWGQQEKGEKSHVGFPPPPFSSQASSWASVRQYGC